jgi:acyl-CoA thioesterase FadM
VPIDELDGREQVGPVGIVLAGRWAPGEISHRQIIAWDWDRTRPAAYGPHMLRTTHTSTVTEDQIDHLGHMNVRFYAVNAHAGTRAILADLPGWDDRQHVVDDTYTRHHREQLLGTDLVVRSAVLEATPTRLRFHHELAAADTGVLAATFVHGLAPVDEDRRPTTVPEAALEAASAQAIPLPEHAATRTISLDADLMAATPTLELVQERGLAMRQPRRVAAEECDASGRYRVEMAPLLTWAGEAIAGDPSDILHETSDGILMGWASMETRIILGTLPRPGDHVQAFGACVAVHDKVMHRLHWAYDLDTGALLTAFESVSMAFDIKGRRPISIPDGYRQRELERLQPDLVPQIASA